MIYFDVETKKTILKKIRGCVLPHVSLFLGTAETTLNLDPAWKLNSTEARRFTNYAQRRERIADARYGGADYP